MPLRIEGLSLSEDGVELVVGGRVDAATARELRRLIEADAPVEIRRAGPEGPGRFLVVIDQTIPPDRVDLCDPVTGRLIGRIEGLDDVPSKRELARRVLAELGRGEG